MNAPLAIIDKRRTDVNVAEVMHIIGDVEGQHCLIVDDLIDTAGTLVKGAEALLKQGALSVTACATHAVLSGTAVERIEKSLTSGSGGDEFHSAARRRHAVLPHQDALGGSSAGARHSVNPRGRFGKHTIHLESEARFHAKLRRCRRSPAGVKRYEERDYSYRRAARSTRGKNEARRLRVKGLAPAVLYGAQRDAVPISVNPKEVQQDTA